MTVMGMRYRAYNNVMTYKRKKAKRQKAGARPGESGPLRASVEDELGLQADEDTGGESRWNRPRRQRISLRVDIEVLDWFKSKGPGYQPRINRILRQVMIESKKRTKKDKAMELSTQVSLTLGNPVSRANFSAARSTRVPIPRHRISGTTKIS